MNSTDKIEEGKNGLRSYQFESVEKNRRKVNRHWDGYQEKREVYTINGMFYSKICLYFNGEFEARRVDTAFCCQGCQKAHLRSRKRKLKGDVQK